MNNFIGSQIEILNDSGEIIKTITVKDQKEINGELCVTDSEGNIYSEDQLNLRYVATPEALLWMTLEQNGFSNNEFDNKFNFEVYHKVFEEFMDKLVRSGVIEEA